MTDLQPGPSVPAEGSEPGPAALKPRGRRRLEDLPIRRKVTFVIMATCVSVLLLTTVAFTVYDVVTFRRALADRLSRLATIIAADSAPALANRDAVEGERLLGSLQAEPDVVSAALYDQQGKLFAQFARREGDTAVPANSTAAGYRFDELGLVVTQPVARGATPLGSLSLRAAFRPLQKRLQTYVAIAGAVLLSSLLVAWALSNVLERRITGPILNLAEAARAVSLRGDFSIRAGRHGQDELGLLTDAFNEMLERLQAQTVALQKSVDELKQAEEQRSFLAAIVNSSDAAIVGKDLTGNVVSWNSGAERMFGFTAAEMIGQPITRVVAEDRPEEEPRILKEAREGHVRNYETVRRRKDGAPIEVSLTVSPIQGSQGRIIGISSIARDITQRKQSEREVQESRARLSGIISSAMDAIITIDSQQRVQLFNASAERMFRRRAEDMLGQPLDQLLPERFREGHRSEVDRFGLTGDTSRAMGHLRPLAGRRSDGEEFPIEASISQVEVDGQKIYTVILRDVTERARAQQLLEEQIAERKRAEEEVRTINLELEERVEARTAELTAANRELEAFTYSVAHDLRAPLRHMDAFARILQEDYGHELTAEAQHFVQSIRVGSRHMSQLVDDLLNLARLGRQELKRQPTNLSAVVSEVLVNLKQETEGRAIEWRLNPLPTLDCDPGLIKQVFANLLANAIKYSRPRSPAVIEVGAVPHENHSAVYVRDNGVGFNMKYVDKLFGVFQRLHRAEEFEGTGVGLATVQRIVRKHGGAVWAEGALGKGASFYFTVAANGTASPAAPGGSAPPPAPPAA